MEAKIVKKTPSNAPIMRISGNYQVTIPTEMRKLLNVGAGDYVQIFYDRNMVFFRPIDIVDKLSGKKIKKDDEDWWRECVDENMWKQYSDKDNIYDDVVL